MSGGHHAPVSVHLFVLCPPYSGSTVLWKLCGTSPVVSALPNEGQYIPTVKQVLVRDPWAEERILPWPFIRQAWERYWDLGADVLLEKSPPNLLRARDMEPVFAPAYFLVMVREPYAFCEGVIRRWAWSARQTAEFAVRLMTAQRENLEQLEHTLRLTYEELVADPAGVARRIEAFVPGLGGVNPEHKFRVHAIDGLRRRGIVDLNQRKVDNLSPDELADITAVLEEHGELLAFWGYALRRPDAEHARRHERARRWQRLTAPWRKLLEVLVFAWWQVKSRWRRWAGARR